MSTWFSAAAVLPQLRAEWGLSSGESAWLTIAVQLGFVVGALGAALLNLSMCTARSGVLLGARSARPRRTRCWPSSTVRWPRCRCGF